VCVATGDNNVEIFDMYCYRAQMKKNKIGARAQAKHETASDEVALRTKEASGVALIVTVCVRLIDDSERRGGVVGDGGVDANARLGRHLGRKEREKRNTEE
jgi:hypothetical protein